MVVDNLYDDTLSLKSCSLVAHTFVASSRIHIFKKIEIAKEIAPLKGKGPTPCQKLLKLLISSPHIARLVEDLSIVLSWGHSDVDYVWDDAHSDQDVDLWIMTGRTLTLVLPSSI
ncbi:hypothetical protein DFH08DRAFT_828967 [Mycena albidolilacea]|uniref:Uncharacterized protein n=1 Tax=Mycena albidolilacea TaxID=1033008 RepID=A0AAD7F5M7_9AGAR|nr:hypothetical protein DFH08DRAFT_828967 [Mycena albidolilacea]